MNIVPHHRFVRTIQRRQRLSRSTLRGRIDALRLRLARYGLLRHGGARPLTGRITPMERVMLRSAIHVNRSFTAYLSLQALLSAGAARHTHRVETLRVSERAAPARAPALRQLDRVLVAQRVLHERLVQRMTATAAHPALPRAAMVTRVEQRHTFPKVQLTLVRIQPAVTEERQVRPDPAAVASPGLRAAAQRPYATTAAPPAALSAQELSRLADHVIRQFDHRVLSYQERTGRV